jgi:hypothetical protein
MSFKNSDTNQDIYVLMEFYKTCKADLENRVRDTFDLLKLWLSVVVGSLLVQAYILLLTNSEKSQLLESLNNFRLFLLIFIYISGSVLWAWLNDRWKWIWMITGYLQYLEKKINEKLSDPIALWNYHITRLCHEISKNTVFRLHILFRRNFDNLYNCWIYRLHHYKPNTTIA